jgi:hypothetical protein
LHKFLSKDLCKDSSEAVLFVDSRLRGDDRGEFGNDRGEFGNDRGEFGNDRGGCFVNRA